MYLFHLVLAPPPTFRLASGLFADRRRTVLRLCVLWRVGSTPTLNGFADSEVQTRQAGQTWEVNVRGQEWECPNQHHLG